MLKLRWKPSRGLQFEFIPRSIKNREQQMLSNTIINQWGYLLRIFSSFDEFPVFASTEEGQPGRSPSFSVEFVVGKFFRIGKKSTKKFEENKVQLYPHFFITKNSVSWSFLGQIHIYCIEPVLPQIQN